VNQKPVDITGSKGFTLIEILFSVTVLSLLVVLLSNLAASTLATWSRSKWSLDGNAALRPINQTILLDIEQMIRGGDLPVFPEDGPRSALGFFITNPSADSTSSRPLAYVEYVWDETTAELTREPLPLGWEDPPPFGGTAPDMSTVTTNFPSTPGILAFFLTFQDASGAVQHQFDPATSRFIRLGWVQCSAEVARILAERGRLAEVVNGLKPPQDSGAPFHPLWDQKIEQLVAEGKLAPDLSTGLQISQIIRPIDLPE